MDLIFENGKATILQIPCSLVPSKLSLVRYQVIGDPECRTRFALELVQLNLIHQLPKHQTLRCAIENGQVGDYSGYTSRTGERKCAFYPWASATLACSSQNPTYLPGSLGFHCGQHVPRCVSLSLKFDPG